MRGGEHSLAGAGPEGEKLGLIPCCPSAPCCAHGNLLHVHESPQKGHPHRTGAEVTAEVTAGRTPEHVAAVLPAVSCGLPGACHVPGPSRLSGPSVKGAPHKADPGRPAESCCWARENVRSHWNTGGLRPHASGCHSCRSGGWHTDRGGWHEGLRAPAPLSGGSGGSAQGPQAAALPSASSSSRHSCGEGVGAPPPDQRGEGRHTGTEPTLQGPWPSG